MTMMQPGCGSSIMTIWLLKVTVRRGRTSSSPVTCAGSGSRGARYRRAIDIPRPEQVAYFGVLAALAAFEIVEWPIAAVVAAGHVLAENQHSRVAREFGEALENA